MGPSHPLRAGIGQRGQLVLAVADKGTSPGTGRLYLQINDEANDLAFADNDGELVVEVKRNQ